MICDNTQIGEVQQRVMEAPDEARNPVRKCGGGGGLANFRKLRAPRARAFRRTVFSVVASSSEAELSAELGTFRIFYFFNHK